MLALNINDVDRTQWRGRRVLVTGAAGFLGSHLCEQLLAAGARVTGMDNFCTGSPDNLATFGHDPNFRFIEHDVAVEFNVSGPVDCVLHFASPASPKVFERLGLATLAAGAAGSWHALQLAERAQARFVLASTSEVYGDPLEHPQRESYRGNVSTVGPRSVYDEAKRYAEALTMAFHRERNVDVGIVRIFNTYGPRMRPEDGRVVPEFVRRALAGEPLQVTGDGRQTRSMCYVSDMVGGILAMAAAAGTTGPINLGNPTETAIVDLAHEIRALCVSASPMQFVPRPPEDPARRRPDVTKAAQLLGWVPLVELRDGLAATIEATRLAPESMPAQPSAATR